MMSGLRKALWFVIVLLSINTSAQQLPTEYYALQEEGWFPKQSVLSVFQDSKGRLWIGTNAGLYQYNLSSLVNYNLTQKSQGKLLNNSVYAIGEDKNGNILVGTESGLGVLDVRSEEITRITTTDKTIVKIYKGKAGNIWCLDSSGNIYRLSFSEGKYQYELFVSIGGVLNDIFQLPDGSCLVGTNHGLFQVLINKSINRIGFDHQVTSIYASDTTIFLGTANKGAFSGELRKHGSQIKFVSNRNFQLHTEPGKNYVNLITGLNDRQLIVSTPFAVYIVDRGNIEQSRKIGRGLTHLKEGIANALLVDRSKNIWIGTQKGLYKYRQPTLIYDYYEIETSFFDRTSLVNDLLHVPDQEKVYIATSTDGIYSLDPSTHKLSSIKFQEKNIKALGRSHDKELFITTPNKLYKTENLGNGEFRAKLLYADTRNQFNQALEVFPNEYWLTSWTGEIVRVNTGTHKLRERVFKNMQKQLGSVNHLFCIEKDDKNNVWLGSRGDGIFKVSLADGSVKQYRHNTKPVASSRIISIDKDSKGRIWVSTRGDGLLLYDHNADNFKVFGTSDGLPSNTVCGFTEASNGEIWVSTLSGLARFDEDNLISFQNYGTEDGLYSTEFNFKATTSGNDGVIYFGTGSGFIGIYSAMEYYTSDFPLIFTDFMVMGQTRSRSFSGVLKDYVAFKESDSLIALEHNENNIQITFSALDYTLPIKNKYAYKLLGYDKEWRFAKGESGVAKYFDLPPGSYRLEVKGVNAFGKWTTTPIFLEFKVKQFFWLSKTALLIYLLILALLSLAAYYLWKKWFKLNDELLRDKDELEKHQQKMIFYTDLSHEIKNRLSLILGPLEESLRGKKVNQNVLKNLYGQALRLNKLSNQILNIRKGEYGKFNLATSEKDVSRVLNEVYLEMQPLAILKGLQFEFVPGREMMLGWIDEELLEIIVLNILSNAIKYSNHQGTVRMKAEIQYLEKEDIKTSFQKDGNYLFCSITNTGIGIPKEGIDKVRHSFYRAENTRLSREDYSGTGIGLDLVNRLVYLHKGWLDIESELNESTVVNFYLPLDKEQYNADEIKPDKDISIVIPANLTEAEDELIQPDFGELSALTRQESYRILIAEDDVDIKEMILNSLSPFYEVYSAGDGDEALKIVESVNPDLILSDLVMPNMDGLTFCRAIRERQPDRHVPFIILTGRNSEEQKLVCFQNGVDDFMEKPFSPELLKWRVKSMLETFNKMNSRPANAIPEIEIPESADDRFINDVIAIIDKNLDKEYLNVEFMANEMCMSRATFYRKMDTLLSESPSTFIRKYRLKRAAILLSSKKYSVSEVSYHVGFNDPSYFAKCFQKEFNTSPSSYGDLNALRAK